jgi:UDP-glucose 6-dehydrogenase
VVYDVANPKSNSVGIPEETDMHRSAAETVLNILPKAPMERIVRSRESELLKYVTNSFYYTKVVYMNMMYDLAESLGCNWQPIRELLGADPWVGNMHLDPVHKTGRGAGGGCLVKDFASFQQLFEKEIGDKVSLSVIQSIEKKNLELLRKSGKDQDIVAGVYGAEEKQK